MMRAMICLWWCLLAGSVWAADRPNIVFMIADDCTYRDLGCYGGQAHTPHLDQLAAEGMRFTRCFQAAPMCSPTRHSIYTGQYPVKTGAYPNHTAVNPGVQSIVQYLQPLGYRVAHSGKSHVGPASVFAWEQLPGKNNPDFRGVDAFLAKCQQEHTPFCLLLCSNEPHSPWNLGDPSRYPPDQVELPAYFVDTPETRDAMSRYLAEITYFDSQVGQAIELLDKHGLSESTLFMVVSEQGSSLPFAKWTLYDNGLQSACLVRWPDKVAPASVNPAMIEYIDFLPTFIEAAGGTPAPQIDGKSLLPVLEGRTDHKQFVFGEMTTRGINNGSDFYGSRSVRSDKFKLIWNFTPEVTFENACTNSPEFKSWLKAARQGNPDAQDKVRRYQHRPQFELYDIVADPLEWRNLADDPSYAPQLAELHAVLQQWMAHCGDRGQATELEAREHMPKQRSEQ